MNHFKVKFALFYGVVCSFGLVDKMLFVPPVFSLLTRKQPEYRQYYQRQGSQVVVLLTHTRGYRKHEIAKKMASMDQHDTKSKYHLYKSLVKTDQQVEH